MLIILRLKKIGKELGFGVGFAFLNRTILLEDPVDYPPVLGCMGGGAAEIYGWCNTTHGNVFPVLRSFRIVQQILWTGQQTRSN